MNLNKKLLYNIIYCSLILFITSTFLQAQTSENNNEKGNLFIIGGGKKPDDLIKAMVSSANLEKDDYIVVLPMASSKPKKGIEKITEEIRKFSNNDMSGIYLDKANSKSITLADSIARAKLIYVIGGSQKRFMKSIEDTPIQKAIHKAYNNGSTIAGTSAGAAIMSEVMITGQHNIDLKTRKFKDIRRDSVRTVKGLGLLPYHNIIDQHFIKRSRFNRLISILADFPAHQTIGIDESTAIICHDDEAKVVGESQVVVMSNPQGLVHPSESLVRFKNIDFALYTTGDTFQLK